MKKILLLMFLSVAAFAVDDATRQHNAELFGIWTLVPPVVAIALAFITKEVILSLFIGVFSGTYMLAVVGNNPISALVGSFTDLVSRVVGSMASKGNAGVLLQVLCIGGVVALISRTGGTKAVALWISKRAKTGISAQISTPEPPMLPSMI